MSRLVRYGFPIFAGLFMGGLFLSKNIYVQAFVVAFTFWGAMEVAGRLNDDHS